MIINRRYEILKKLGEGRSQVFLVKDYHFPKENFAMKIISKNASISEIHSFQYEYYLLKEMNHPNIIKPYFNGTVRNIIGDLKYDIAEEDQFYTMEYVDGKNLAEVQQEILIKNFNDIISQISAVLFYLHQSNLIYFDLKPENILLLNKEGVNLRFIDFGFVSEYSVKPIENIKGSPFLISPEILNHSTVNFQSDIYSLGILMYWILFGIYPFNAKDELDIYKLHITSKINFPKQANLDRKICNVIEKCTEKEPHKRFRNTLSVAAQFNDISKKINADSFANVNKYYNRNDIEKSLHDFFADKEKFMCLILGEENTGKSRLIENVKKNILNALIIDFGKQLEVVERWKRVIIELLLVDSINKETRNTLLNYFVNHFNESEANIDEIIITIFSKISAESDFIFLVDNYDLCDEFSNAILLKLFNVLTINKKKLIITTRDAEVLSNVDKIQINLSPLNENEVDDFVNMTFYEDYPKKELSMLIKKYSDKKIGSINLFIKELISLKIISYSNHTPIINLDKESKKIIVDRISYYLEKKYEDMNQQELLIISLISVFESINEKQISELLSVELPIINAILDRFENQNLTYSRRKILSIKFIADSYKQYFYNKIIDKKKYHIEISEKIKSRKDFSVKEKLYHFENAEKYSFAVDLLIEEIKSLQTISAFSSIVNYYRRIIAYPIDEELKLQFKIELLDTLLKMNDIKSAASLLFDIDKQKAFYKDSRKLSFLRGQLLYRLGKVNESLALFNNMLKDDTKDNSDIKIEIANICIDLADYPKLFDICSELINQENVAKEIIARAYNLLALGKIYQANSFSEAAELFKKSICFYEKINDKNKIAGLETNLGNVLNALGDSKSALVHWERAQNLNQNIGNFTQEANVLQNIGVYYSHDFNYEDSIEKYQRAKQIFETIGDKSGAAIAYYNIAEIKIFSMEYQEAKSYIEKAKSTCASILSEDGILFSNLLETVLLKKLERIDDIRNIKLMFEQKKNVESIRSNLKYISIIESLFLNSPVLTENIINEVLLNLLSSNDIYLIFDLSVELSTRNYIELIKNSVVPFIEQEETLSQKDYFRAMLLFLKGQIAEVYKDAYQELPINFYLKTYEILSALSVSELTLKVIFKIAEFYENSGNFWKAREFFNYLVTLVDYVVGQIDEEKLLIEIKNSKLFAGVFEFISAHRNKFIDY